jgi:hypothetical protein
MSLRVGYQTMGGVTGPSWRTRTSSDKKGWQNHCGIASPMRRLCIYVSRLDLPRGELFRHEAGLTLLSGVPPCSWVVSR